MGLLIQPQPVPLVSWPWELVVALDVVAWTLVSLGAGWWAARLAPERLRDGPFSRLRRFEQGGAWYRRYFRITRWKDLLPEAGAMFGGLSKRRLPGGLGRRASLVRFAQECRRAERTHATIVVATPAFVLWNPPGLMAAMVAYALVANVPCLLVQRYNRARLDRVLGDG